LEPLPVELSFEKGLFVVVRAIQLLTSHQPGKARARTHITRAHTTAALTIHTRASFPALFPTFPPPFPQVIVVGLAGPSGAGKTELSRRLRELTPTLTVISLDNFLDTSAIVDGNFDDPRLTDFARLCGNLEDLKVCAPVMTWHDVA
jgi:hypothetical protein